MESRISKFVKELECQVLLNDEQALLFVGKGSGIIVAAGDNCKCNNATDNCSCKSNNCKCNNAVDNCTCNTTPIIPGLNTNFNTWSCK